MNLWDAAFGNLSILEDVFESYQRDPQSVDPSWRKAFATLDQKSLNLVSAPVETRSFSAGISASSPSITHDRRIDDLIQAYRTQGHLMGRVNPLLEDVPMPAQLKLDNFDLSDADLSKDFPTHGFLAKSQATLQEILDSLQEIYCGNVSVEYVGLGNLQMEQWIQQQIEPNGFERSLSIEKKKIILQDLNRSELFEIFLHTKYTGQKRFSLEGGETLIPMLEAIIDKGSELGIKEFVIGMAHRGRLNVLSNIMHKAYAEIFTEFDENYVPESRTLSGDVKYHKGFFSEALSSHGHKVLISLTPNPSHLEAVDPVVEGQVYAKQKQLSKEGKKMVMPLLIHGDAALSGQGVIYEILQFKNLEGYGTGGTLHLVINNQIGFTTIPEDSRSTLYCTDIARAFNSPVFHVNAEDPEGCVAATLMAVELRQKFGCDVFIDLVCYRKYGHNEADEPAFTQPHEYQMITKKHSIREIYRDHLVHHGVLEKSIAEELEVEFKSSLQKELEKIKTSEKKSLDSELPDVEPEHFSLTHIQTGVSLGLLQEIAEKACHIPEGFVIHPKLERIVKERLSMIKGSPLKPIDWGMAEMLAFGSLLWDKVDVRLSGQDCCRGTFSHRHAMWMDQQQERPYYPLKHLKPDQGTFDVFNSPLSEFGVLGFELGYSLERPNSLVLWEAQFGDFCNGAQVIIDQFISTGEQKWGQKFGLVLLLPHGYEGQGPEHSSGRIERFLALAGQSNLCIVNPSTPAQMFHLLRRQHLQNVKKPLIVFTPKALLRHPECVSQPQAFTMGSFQEFLDDPSPPERVRRLALCSGHVYYDLLSERAKVEGEDLAIVRVEQLYPFDRERFLTLLDKYKPLEAVYWVQEEPANMGAGQFMCLELQELLPKEIPFSYIARPRSASPAVGSYVMHKRQLKDVLEAVFGQKKPSIFDIAAKKSKKSGNSKG